MAMKTKFKFHISGLLILSSALLFLMAAKSLKAKNPYTSESDTVEVLMSNGQAQLVMPAQTTSYGLKKQIDKMNILVVFDMYQVHEQYKFGGPDSDYPFEYDLEFSLTAFDEAGNPMEQVFNKSRYNLRIQNGSPQEIFFKDLSNFKITEDGSDYLQIDKVVIHDIDVSPVNNELSKHRRILLIGNVDYAYSVEDISGNLAEPPYDLNAHQVGGEKEITFSWKHIYPFSMYQLQVMRLYNVDKEATTEQIAADIDWSRALTFELPVQNMLDENGNLVVQKSFDIRLLEGSGFYIWRVRPVGTYFSNGVGNFRNWGQWSDAPQGMTILTKQDLASPFFHFSDPDADRNTIYKRVFTEDNKMKQVSTYADGLLNKRQTQTYLPSADVTIIAQTLQDFSGRSVLTTLPMPIQGEQHAYKKDFIQNQEGKLYTAQNFDNNDTEGVPERMNEEGAMDYYNENSQDERIPNADGYPFSRKTFYNNTLNRVKEEAGPGKAHQMKPGMQGHTVKHFYGIPSETELVRLFGKEAPNSETVRKEVTVDENNVATVTYTSLQGKKLATGLTFLDEFQNSSMLPVSDEPEERTFEVEDRMSSNIATGYGFLSSKQILISQQTDLFINYKLSCPEINFPCQKINVDCNFDLQITMTNLSTGKDTVLYSNAQNTPLKDINCSNDGYKTIGAITVNGVEPGKYLIEKRLNSGSAADAKQQVSADELESQITPLINLITDWYKSVRCPDVVANYYDALAALKDNINNLDNFSNPSPFPTNQNYWVEFIDGPYQDSTPTGEPLKELYDIVFWKITDTGWEEVPTPTQDNPPDIALVSTGCCDIEIPVKYISFFDMGKEPELVDRDGDGELEVINYGLVQSGEAESEYYPDFEGFAKSYFEGCDKLEGNKFYDYMPGYKPGMFNLMVYHMLTDEYDGSNPHIEVKKDEDDKDKPKKDACGNIIDVGDCVGDTCKWYVMRDLFECWLNQLERLRMELQCPGAADFNTSSALSDTSYNISRGVDEQNDGDRSRHDNAIDDGFANSEKGWFLIRWLAKRKMSKKIRSKSDGVRAQENTANYSDEEGVVNFHLVESFLQCAGYQFAKVLTPYDAEPLADDVATGYEYALDKDESDDSPVNKKLSEGISYDQYLNNYAENFDYPYVPLNNWNPKFEDTESKTFAFEDLVRNPIYAFKYYTYPTYGDSNYVSLESANCFEDINDCYELDAEGHIKVDDNGNVVTVPCCIEHEGQNPVNSGLCYEDTEYPNHPGGKYIVSHFKGEGRIRCEYTHEAWSNEERYTFFQSLLNFKPPNGAWNDGLHYDKSCVDLVEPTSWYVNSDYETNQLPRLMNSSERVYYNNNFDDFYINVNQKFPFVGYDGESKYTISFAEIRISELLRKCRDTCEGRKDEIRQELMAMLSEKCYEIGGCRDENNPQVIPESDIDTIVNRIVEECTSQCQMNTFGCRDINQMRILKTPKWQVGATGGSDVDFVLGLGGFPEDYEDCYSNTVDNVPYVEASSLDYSDANYASSGWGDWNDDGENDIIRCDLTNYDKNDYSWFQYTKVHQAKSWHLEMDMPSACPEDTLSREFVCCDSTSVNENANTFIDKNEYEPIFTSPFSEEHQETRKVHSPAKGIIIDVNEEE